ncbi:MAG: divalent-cation tolerance protein CutA [Phycisphaerales bacterium]|nr:divalent-cation tolerance protein CutA [Phycisphaerales bacterium]
MTGVFVVLSTAPDAEARALADALLEERLVACVNIVGGVRSRYVWKGSIEEASEALLVMKTSADRLPALRARLVALHSYEVPECLAFEVGDGHAPYLAWVLHSCRGSPPPSP